MGKIIAFSAPKDGVGRTSLIVALSKRLQESGKRVLIIDWDLCNPSTHHALDITPTTKGLIELCMDFKKLLLSATSENPLTEEHLPFPTVENNHITSISGVDLLVAVEVGTSSIKNEFDWIDFHDNNAGSIFLMWLKEKLTAEYDYILIDSSAGQPMHWGITNVMMADANVILYKTPYITNVREMASRIENAKYVKKGNRMPLIFYIVVDERKEESLDIESILREIDNLFIEGIITIKLRKLSICGVFMIYTSLRILLDSFLNCTSHHFIYLTV